MILAGTADLITENISKHLKSTRRKKRADG